VFGLGILVVFSIVFVLLVVLFGRVGCMLGFVVLRVLVEAIGCVFWF